MGGPCSAVPSTSECGPKVSLQNMLRVDPHHHMVPKALTGVTKTGAFIVHVQGQCWTKKHFFLTWYILLIPITWWSGAMQDSDCFWQCGGGGLELWAS